MTKTEKYIIDTNTLVSSFLVRNSIASRAVERAISTGSLYFSNDTFIEFEEVFLRPKFDKYFIAGERIQTIQRLADQSIFVKAISKDKYCRDPKDDKFLNLAIDIKATCIVTGDNDLLVLHPFQNIPILKAADYLTSNV